MKSKAFLILLIAISSGCRTSEPIDTSAPPGASRGQSPRALEREVSRSGTGSFQRSAGISSGSTSQVRIRDTELHYIESKTIGEKLEIDVSLPRDYNNEKKNYPVVYITDAEYNFGAVSYITRRLIKNGDIPKVILVGVAYNVEYDVFYHRRARDLTPVEVKDDRFPESGQADRFIEFLEKELFPFIDSTYRTNTSDRALYGHSFGGLFGFYTLFSHPGLFQRIISLSPSIWYADRYIQHLEKSTFSEGMKLPAVVYTAVGEKEPDYFVKDWKDLVQQIKARDYLDLFLEVDLLEGENHRSIFGAAFTKGMRSIFSHP